MLLTCLVWGRGRSHRLGHQYPLENLHHLLLGPNKFGRTRQGDVNWYSEMAVKFVRPGVSHLPLSRRPSC